MLLIYSLKASCPEGYVTVSCELGRMERVKKYYPDVEACCLMSYHHGKVSNCDWICAKYRCLDNEEHNFPGRWVQGFGSSYYPYQCFIGIK